MPALTELAGMALTHLGVALQGPAPLELVQRQLTSFGFVRPWLLLALVLLVPYAVLRRRRLRAAAVDFPPLQYARRAGRRGWLLAAQVPLETLLLAVLVVALAEPAKRLRVDTIGEDGLDVALALDISASMQAADFEPNRLEALKALAVKFVKRSAAHRIAVYAFAGHAFTQTPLTTDHATLIGLLEGLAYESIDHGPSGGTALGDALLATADGLLRARLEGRDQVLVLVTDDESNKGIDPLLAARFVAAQGMRLYVVGIGGDEEVEVYVHGQPFITINDTILRTSLDEAQLREIAAAAGGRYFRARSNDVLAAIFDELARLETTPLEIEAVEVRFSRAPLLAAAAFLLFAAWLLGEGWLLRSPLR